MSYRFTTSLNEMRVASDGVMLNIHTLEFIPRGEN